MDNLHDLIKHRAYEEPPEIEIIKRFLKDNLNSAASIKVKQSQIIITVSNSALAGSLRMLLPKLQKECGTNKQLLIYIGSVNK